MSRNPLSQPALFLALAATLSLACSSESEDPTVDPGNAHEGGGIENAESVPTVNDVAYPPGPYGHDVGGIVQNFKFVGMLNPVDAGYVADESTIGTLALSDYYNPDDDPGKPFAIVLNASARWCTVCQEEARQSVANYEHWRTRNVLFVTAIFEDDGGEPSTFEDIEYWSEKFELAYPVVLDPALKLGVFFDKSASPFNMIIKTKTMEIVYAEEGLVDLGADNPTLHDLTGQ